MPPSSSLAPENEATGTQVKPYVPREMEDKEYYKPKCGDQYTGVLGDNFKDKPLLQRLNWLHVPLLAVIPIIATYGLLTTPLVWKTALFSWLYYNATGMGITGGYHRLFAHRAYEAKPLLRWAMVLLGTGAVEGSVKWWCHGHRAHHKFVDTPADPYAATKGFWYSHIGWMLVKTDKTKIGRTSVDDLLKDPLIRFQHRYYLPMAILMAFVLPTLVCGLGWGDYAGGYFYGGVIRLFIVHHSTFFVNSLAHFAGDATYTDRHSARNSIITALLTLGEGYHNFHHEFPSDYRNGIEWYQYDPTKVFIRLMEMVGLAYNLQRFPSNEIVKGKLQMTQKAITEEREKLTHKSGGKLSPADEERLRRAQADLDRQKAQVNWGPDPSSLPVWTQEQLDRIVKAEKAKHDALVASSASASASAAATGIKAYVVLDGFVLDVTKFRKEHPGGENYLGPATWGEDVTELFKGKSYKHSQAARNLSATLRIARIQGYWK